MLVARRAWSKTKLFAGDALIYVPSLPRFLPDTSLSIACQPSTTRI
jgi:hypothetical protein